jgi:hypothetical protein
VALKLDRRGYGRKPTNLLATLKCSGDMFSCHIIELSEAGARIRLAKENAVVAGPGQLIAPEIGDKAAEVVWQSGDLVGLRFTAVKQRATGMPTRKA